MTNHPNPTPKHSIKIFTSSIKMPVIMKLPDTEKDRWMITIEGSDFYLQAQ